MLMASGKNSSLKHMVEFVRARAANANLTQVRRGCLASLYTTTQPCPSLLD